MNTREICLKIIEKLFHGYTLESITENLDDFKGLSKKDKAFVKNANFDISSKKWRSRFCN